MTAPRRIIVSDGKPRPSWIADDMEELLVQQLKERLRGLGATGMGASWEYYRDPAGIRRVRGQVIARFGETGSIAITAPTPMDAVRLAARTLRLTDA